MRSERNGIDINLKSTLSPGLLGKLLSTFLIENRFVAEKNNQAPSEKEICEFESL